MKKCLLLAFEAKHSQFSLIIKGHTNVTHIERLVHSLKILSTLKNEYIFEKSCTYLIYIMFYTPIKNSCSKQYLIQST